jgi:hypothetical protein
VSRYLRKTGDYFCYREPNFALLINIFGNSVQKANRLNCGRISTAFFNYATPQSRFNAHLDSSRNAFSGSSSGPRHLNPTGCYRTNFKIPKDWKNRRIVLHIGGAESVLYVRMNGLPD